MKVTLVSVTSPTFAGPLPDGNPPPRTAEELLVYCARVSSPANQGSHATGERLLRYCLKAGHWSVFEQADMTVEVETSRAIAAQILRHRSFTFQEFSQRYADVSVMGFEEASARRQDTKNRQASHDDLPREVREWFSEAQEKINATALRTYEAALAQGIAKECARFILPLSVRTRLYMKGSVRSWIHYFQARDADGVQVEHRAIAQAARTIFAQQFPTVDAAMRLGD